MRRRSAGGPSVALLSPPTSEFNKTVTIEKFDRQLYTKPKAEIVKPEEIDRPQSNKCACFCLLSELPSSHSFLNDPFIHSGYRVHHNFSSSLRSIFSLHNETFNMHTHLWGFFLFVALTYITFCLHFPLWTSSAVHPVLFLDYLIVASFFATVQFCFFSSFIFHTFLSISQSTHRKVAMLDYGGILIYMFGCTLSSLYYGFYCIHDLQRNYIAAGLLLYIIATPLAVFHKEKAIRLKMFFALSMYPIIPLVHWVVMSGFEMEDVQLFLWRIVVNWLILGCAFAVYLTRIPERFYPGRFDIWFSSHQFWHLLTVAGALWQYDIVLRVLEYRFTTTCPVY